MEQTTVRMAALLRQAKEDHGQSLRELEAITFIPRNTLAKIFAGEAIPNMLQIQKLATVFGTTTLALIAQAESDEAA